MRSQQLANGAATTGTNMAAPSKVLLYVNVSIYRNYILLDQWFA